MFSLFVGAVMMSDTFECAELLVDLVCGLCVVWPFFFGGFSNDMVIA